MDVSKTLNKSQHPRSAGLSGFIEKARARHGDRYDYSQAEYVNARTKVTIICREHGPFPQSPDTHTSRGHGCPKCSVFSPEELHARCIAKHGNTYDYSNTVFRTTNDYVKILCPKHGEFKQRLSHHLDGRGCRDCRDESMRISRETFIQKAIEKHGTLYDYSRVDYQGAFEKVEILCPIHGSFWQSPDGHANAGARCPFCYHAQMNTERFISQAKEKHGDLYDYSLALCESYRDMVQIICKTHGVFSQQASNHLDGKGCAKCIGLYKTTEDFITEARQVHGDLYDYSKLVYIGWDEKVTITCPEHGDFHQQAGSHIYGNGSGCPGCKGYTWWNYLADGVNVPATLYMVRIWNSEEAFLKIGLTLQTVEDRFAPHRNDYSVETLATKTGPLQEIYDLEQMIHAKYTEYNYTPKLEFGGCTECFVDTPELAATLRQEIT